MTGKINFHNKKYGKIFMYSFIWMLPMILASPYVTARAWADLIIFFGAGLCVYDLVYIFYLRKKEDISFGRTVENCLLYFHIMVLFLICYSLGETFIRGYTAKDWVGNAMSDTVYGIEAIRNDGWGNLFRTAIFIPASIYVVAYFIINKVVEKHENN